MHGMTRRTAGWCVLGLALVVGVSSLATAQPKPSGAAARETDDLLALAREMEKQVAELRGWEFKRPVEACLRSEEHLRKFIEKRLLEEQYGGGRLEQTEAFLRMVGLIPEGCELKKTILDVLLNQVGGFYDHETKSFFMLKREGVGYGPLITRTLVVHELTHALDDQYVNLGKLITPNLTEDMSIAIGAVVEGSATVLMMRYLLREISSGKYDAAELGETQRQEMERSEAFLRAPPYFSTLLANYMCGMHFISRGKSFGPTMPWPAEGVGENMLAACKDPPTSSEQILHPQKYWDPEQRDDPVIVNDDQVERLLRFPGLHVVHRNTVGELLCSLLASDPNRELNVIAAALPNYWTNFAAEGWGGDRFFLLAEGGDVETAKKNLSGLKGVWVTVWDTSADRDEFVEQYRLEREIPAHSVFRLRDRGAGFLFGFDPARRAEVQRRFEQTPPRLMRSGRPWRWSEEKGDR